MILKKDKECEQVVFIKGWNRDVLLIEMAGGEFCGNAIRAVMYYLNLTQGKTCAQIKYINYPFVVSCECVESNCSFKANIHDIVKRFIEIKKGFIKVEMDGITHYIVEPKSEYFKCRNNKQKTGELIKHLNGGERSIGIMYLQNFNMKAYVYVKAVNTLYCETACGSGTIACAMLFKDSEIVQIKQASGEYLSVEFNEDKLTLSGKCEMLLQDYITI